MLQAEQDRGPDLLRLANALSALYPKETEEKRLLAMLLHAEVNVKNQPITDFIITPCRV
jgi:hypothetical protein